MRLLGAKAIAHACDLTTDAVYKWAKTGAGFVPARHMATVLRLAHEKGVTITLEEIIGIAA